MVRSKTGNKAGTEGSTIRCVRAFRWWLTCMALSLGLLTAGGSMAQSPESLEGLEAVLDELREGGFVIYFRHAATDHSGGGEDAVDLGDCATQRNLSVEGREQAERIGSAFRDLGIPVGTVFSSPFCRCKDTAQLAFGNFTVSDDLYFAIGVDAEETARITESLRRMLAAPPATGTNTILVSHTANLREAAEIWPKPEGVAYIFRPLGNDDFEPVSRVLPLEWLEVAERG